MEVFLNGPIKAKLLARAREIFAGCRSLAFDGRTPVFAPDASGYYLHLYWRDFCYTIEGGGELVSLEDIEAVLHYLLEPLPTEEKVFPKGRTRDGEFTYNCQYPGPEKLCSADNPMFAVKAVSEFVRRSGKVDIFRKYSAKLEDAVLGVDLSKSHLVQDPVGPYVYGFYDTVCLTGEECFASVLFLDAATRLAEMFDQFPDASRANRWRKAAENTRASLSRLWSEDRSMFTSDTGSNRQIDVWGSAYAVYSGAVNEEQGAKISEWFVKNYERCARRGHVRHLPSPEYWKHMAPDARPPGEYQNGGFWSVPTPWVAHTIALSDTGLAERMRKDLATALLELDFPECLNEDGSLKLPRYTASAAMGLLALFGP